jgi:hypothetical protein
MKATDAQNTAYRSGLCVGLCGRRYSAGRSRCDECHTDLAIVLIAPELTRKAGR